MGSSNGSRIVRDGNKIPFLPNEDSDRDDAASRHQINRAFYFSKDKPVNQQANIQASVQSAMNAERNRKNEIKAIGNKFGFQDEAEQFAESGKTVDEFHQHILAKSPSELEASLASTPAAREAETQQAVAKIKERRRGVAGNC
jgi:hypothetical protein